MYHCCNVSHKSLSRINKKYKKIIVMTKQTKNDSNNKAAIFCRSSTNSTDDTGNTDDSPTTNIGGRTSMRLLRIAVGTTNPCKIDAVTKAIKQSIESTTGSIDSVDIDLQGFSVDSSVPDQPFGDKQTINGAKNRAVNAYRAYREVNNVYPHLSFGLEGGLEWNTTILDQDNDKTLWCMAWMAVYGRRKSLLVDIMASRHSTCWQPDKKPIFSLSKTGSFMLPQPISKLVKEGMELGDADDKISGRTKSSQGSGTVGYLTDGMIDRSAYYEHALILALVPWIRPDMYNSKGLSTNNDDTATKSEEL